MIIYYTGKTIAKVEKPGFNMINQEWRAFYLLTLHDLFFDLYVLYYMDNHTRDFIAMEVGIIIINMNVNSKDSNH